MIWLSSGIALGGLMLGGIRLWPGVLVGAAMTTALTGGSAILVLGTAVANTGEAVLAVWLFGRLGLHRRMESRRELFVFLGVLVFTTSLSAIASVGSLAASGGAVAGATTRLWLMWWLTHVLGGVALTPLILSAPPAGDPVPRLPTSESFFLSVGLAVTLTMSFTALTPAPLLGAPVAFLSFPFLLWAAYRCGQFGASSASLAAAAFAVGGTLLGQGPFVSESTNTSLFLTLLFVSGAQFSTLFVAGLVGERRTAEGEREELERRMQRSQRLESLGALAGGIAHDFNNLLVAIAGNVDLVLMDTDPDDPSYRLLGESMRASERAAELCRQLLGYAGQGPFEQRVVDLGSVVEDMTELLRVTVPTGTRVEYEVPTEALHVRADPDQLRQLLINLFSNAGDALVGGEGRITLSLSVAPKGFARIDAGVSLLEPPEGPFAVLRIEDDGEGIAPEDLEQIFQPVFSTRGPGRGIGLASVLGIVRKHNGSIHVSSTPGQGSTFTVLLPLAEDPPDAEGLAPPIRPFARGGVALIVDDRKPVRDATSLLVRRLGFEVVEAEDGEAAMARLEEIEGQVSWVLMDITMPGRDGLVTLRRMRQRGYDVPVLLSSGYLQLAEKLTELAPARFLPKPYTLAALERAVSDLLGSV